MGVLEEEVRKVDRICVEICVKEVMVTVVEVARDMWKFRYRRAGFDRADALLSRGASYNRASSIVFWQRLISCLIPAGGSVTDALLFAHESDSPCIKVFNVSTGEFVRDLDGDDQFGDSLYVVLICNTGQQGIPELYVCDASNYRIAVLDPMTGDHIRYIGTGRGAGMYIPLYKT